MVQYLFTIVLALIPYSATEEIIYSLNSLKPVHRTSEKFISISIDPSIFLTGLNLSETSLELANHLSPAYIRIAGPSTKYVQYQDENEIQNGNIPITPAMWFGLNEWLNSVELMPVFGINDGEFTGSEWNLQSITSLLDISDKFNISCFWQLGYDCSNQSELQYKTSLNRLEKLIESFPNKTETWKIVASDVTKCFSENSIKKFLTKWKTGQDSKNVVAATVFEAWPTSKTFLMEAHTPLWICSQKSNQTSTFTSALAWAKEVGEAAQSKFEVIFREPRVYEMYEESPIFWVSVLHKQLCGNKVLHVKTFKKNQDVSVFAHCSKHQNDFVRSGAVTVFVINNSMGNHTVYLRFGTSSKITEIQSYVLTSPNEKDTNIFLNNNELNLKSYKQITPKLRLSKKVNNLALDSPAKSIAFFIITDARAAACTNAESSFSEEISLNQDSSTVEEPLIATRSVIPKLSLNYLKEKLQKEVESDERYHKSKRSNLFSKTFKSEEVYDLKLTNSEIKTILENRAKSKAVKKNIVFKSEEMDEIMNKITNNVLKNKNASIKVLAKEKRDTQRDKKDINMKLLKLKSLAESRRLLLQPLKQKSRLRHTNKRRSKRAINLDLVNYKSKISKQNGKTARIKIDPESAKSMESTIQNANSDRDSMFDDESLDFDYDCSDIQNKAKSENVKGIINFSDLNFAKSKAFKDSEMFDSFFDYDVFETSDDQGKKRSLPESQLSNKRYKSLTQDLKPWKPEDILSLENKKISKRQSDKCLSEVENHIDEFINQLTKEDPKLFPANQTKFFDNVTISSKMKSMPTDSNIQKISDEDLENVWNSMFCKVSSFFNGMNSKMKKYVINKILEE